MRLRDLIVMTSLGLPTGCKTWWRRNLPDAGAAASARRSPQVILIGTADHWTLVGTLYPAAAADDDGTSVLLVHQLGSSRREWSPLVQRLQVGRSVTVLAIDLRGHGDSIHGPQGGEVRWESFGTDPGRWAGLVQDVAAAVRYLRTSGGASRVVIAGSSIGGSAAITFAADADPADAAGIALLSPGLDYHGIETRLPMQRYAATGRPALLLAGDQDASSAEAVTALASIGGTLIQHEIYGGDRQHGVALCNVVPARWDRVDAWIREVLRPHRPPAASADASVPRG